MASGMSADDPSSMNSAICKMVILINYVIYHAKNYATYNLRAFTVLYRGNVFGAPIVTEIACRAIHLQKSTNILLLSSCTGYCRRKLSPASQPCSVYN